MKRCFADCSEQQTIQQTKDLPMTTTYESIDPSTCADNAPYTRIQKPGGDYEEVDAGVPANRDYLSLIYEHKEVHAAVPVYSN